MTNSSNSSSEEAEQAREAALQAAIERMTSLTAQIKALTDVLADASARLKKSREDQLLASVTEILESTFGPREDSFERQQAEQAIELIGVTAFVQKVLWSGEEEDIPLVIAMDSAIPQFESLVEMHLSTLLNQAKKFIVRVIDK